MDERVRALYAAGEGPSGTVYMLAASFAEGAERYEHPTDNPVWREMVLHELIHHVQWATGEAEAWPCSRHGETEAYQLGGVFLREQGAPDPVPNRQFWAHVYGRC